MARNVRTSIKHWSDSNITYTYTVKPAASKQKEIFHIPKAVEPVSVSSITVASAVPFFGVILYLHVTIVDAVESSD